MVDAVLVMKKPFPSAELPYQAWANRRPPSNMEAEQRAQPAASSAQAAAQHERRQRLSRKRHVKTRRFSVDITRVLSQFEICAYCFSEAISCNPRRLSDPESLLSLLATDSNASASAVRAASAAGPAA
jgi:hypothetical protein